MFIETNLHDLWISEIKLGGVRYVIFFSHTVTAQQALHFLLLVVAIVQGQRSSTTLAVLPSHVTIRTSPYSIFSRFITAVAVLHFSIHPSQL
ncbi:unnamed protein product [Lactuca virosa]|uniref:Uncharacterized protein n=1 Tax=Lactuca virosa TaxID=75947 RepID=A0AAU9N7Q7_9ASTR|nr:unnamed protein product [Lactuca virosa]